MLDFGRWLRNAAVCTAWMAASPLAALAAPDTWKMPAVTRAAGSVLEWVRDSGDAGGRPFAVVDKQAARIYVFDAAGQLAGESPVLLGSALGDHTVPGVGERAQTGHVPPEERTTPAGRFVAALDRNLHGKEILWVDYEAAVALHRVAAGVPQELDPSSPRAASHRVPRHTVDSLGIRPRCSARRYAAPRLT